MKPNLKLSRAALGLTVGLLAVMGSADGLGTHLGATIRAASGTDVSGLVSTLGGAKIVSTKADGTAVLTFSDPASMKAFTLKARASRSVQSFVLDAPSFLPGYKSLAKADRTKALSEYNLALAVYKQNEPTSASAYAGLTAPQIDNSFNAEAYFKARGEMIQREHPDGMYYASGLKPGVLRPAVAPWEFIGPVNQKTAFNSYLGSSIASGRANAVAIDPFDNRIYYAAGAGGGVAKSTDRGVTWTNLSPDWPTASVSSLYIDPSNHLKVFAGLGDYETGLPGFGIMLTTDGGKTWQNVGQNVFGSSPVTSIISVRYSPNIIIACSGGSAGKVGRSTDGGLTWTDTGLKGNFAKLEDNTAHDTIYVSGGTGGTFGGILRITKDGGATWTNLAPVMKPDPNDATKTVPVPGPYVVACSRTQPGIYSWSSVVYVLSRGSHDVVGNTSGGFGPWVRLSGRLAPLQLPGDADYNVQFGGGSARAVLDCMAVIYNGVPYYHDAVLVGLEDLFFSDDIQMFGPTAPPPDPTWANFGGLGRARVRDNGATIHANIYGIAHNPARNDEFLVATGGGVYRYTYSQSGTSGGGGYTIESLNKNLGFTQFTTLATSATDDNIVAGGAVDLANPNSKGNLADWGITGHGNAGGGYAIDQKNDGVQVATWNAQHVTFTSNKWAGESDLSPNIFDGLYQELYGQQQVWINPNDNNFLYINTQNLWRLDRSTGFWNNISFGWPITSGIISAVGFASDDDTTFYIGTTDGTVWVTRDFGQSYKRIDQLGLANGLQGGTITQISVLNSNKNDLLVSVGGTGKPHVYHCTDTSAATPVWANVSGAGAVGTKLPDLPTNDIVRSNVDPVNTYYACNNTSVWQTIDGGKTWAEIGGPSNKLPNVVFRRLSLNTNGFLMAATYGRGIWRNPVEGSSGGGGGGGGGGGTGVPNLSWTFDKTVFPRGTTGTVTLSLDAAYTANLTVNLTSSDTTRATVTTPVVFAAGETKKTATITVPNPVLDGTVTITAKMGTQTLTQDITTQRYFNSTDTASTVTIAGAKVLSGSVLLTKAVDGQALKYQLTPATGLAGQEMSSTFNITATVANPLTMQVLLDATASDIGAFNPRHNLDVYDWTAAKWVTAGSVVGNVGTITLSPTMGGTITRFIQPGTKLVKVRVATQRRDTLGTSSIIKVSVDRIAVKWQY